MWDRGVDGMCWRWKQERGSGNGPDEKGGIAEHSGSYMIELRIGGIRHERE